MSLFKNGSTYGIYYVVKFRVDAFGWHSAPIKFKLRLNYSNNNIGKEEEKEDSDDNDDDDEKSINLEAYREKQEIWHEIQGGQFSIISNHNFVNDGFVEFGMFETESAWWKGNMILAGIKIKAINNI